MEASNFLALVLLCAPLVSPTTAHALVSTESNFNPWAIGVVGGALLRQPRFRAEALATVHALAREGHNFSVGLGQINFHNLQRLGLTLETAFDPCKNLAAMQTVLLECAERAARPKPHADADQHALQKALSCYYSGNFVTGFRHGYVHKVLQAAARVRPALPTPPNQE